MGCCNVLKYRSRCVCVWQEVTSDGAVCPVLAHFALFTSFSLALLKNESTSANTFLILFSSLTDQSKSANKKQKKNKHPPSKSRVT